MVIGQEAVEGNTACVRDFLRDPSFTQRIIFYDVRVAMLKNAGAAAESIVLSEQCNPWSFFKDGSDQQVVSDLQSCHEKVVSRCRISKDTVERWFGVQSARSAAPSVPLFLSGFRRYWRWGTLNTLLFQNKFPVYRIPSELPLLVRNSD